MRHNLQGLVKVSFWVSILSFEVYESVAECGVRRSSTGLNLNLDFVKTFVLTESTLVILVLLVIRTFWTCSVLFLHCNGCEIWHRRGRSKIVPSRDHVIYYYPTVVSASEDSVHVLIPDAAYILEGCARLRVRFKTATKTSVWSWKQLTVGRACHTQRHTDLLVGTKQESGSTLRRCTLMAYSPGLWPLAETVD